MRGSSQPKQYSAHKVELILVEWGMPKVVAWHRCDVLTSLLLETDEKLKATSVISKQEM